MQHFTSLRVVAIDTTDSHYFTGLASPAAAAVIASVTWVCYDLGLAGQVLPREFAMFIAGLTALVGILMIANFPYYSFKHIDFRGRVPFVAIIAVVLLFSLITVDPPTVFLVAFLLYALSGPVMLVVKRRRGSG